MSSLWESVDSLTARGYTFNLCYCPDGQGYAASFESPEGVVHHSEGWLSREEAVAAAAASAMRLRSA